jgi:hypothetical protein
VLTFAKGFMIDLQVELMRSHAQINQLTQELAESEKKRQVGYLTASGSKLRWCWLRLWLESDEFPRALGCGESYLR